MASRFSLNTLALFALILVGVFFILPNAVFAGRANDTYSRLTNTIIDFYNRNTTAQITDDERAWIAWGVEHEGIPARALHHKERTWMHDSMQQSVSVYEGVYTWEQGVYDYARGEKQHAFETLGHLLHLVMDMHPTVLSTSVQDGVIRNTSVRTWRDIVEEENVQDAAALIQEGADTMNRFFTEAKSADVKKPFTRAHPFTFFFAKTFSVIQERLTFARTNIRSDTQQLKHVLRIAFARVPQNNIGGVVISQPPVVAQAQQVENKEKENAQAQFFVSPHKPSAPLPFATSIPISPASATPSEEVQSDAPVIVTRPLDVLVPEIQESPIAIPLSPPIESLVPPAPAALPPPPPPEVLDDFGFPLGTVRTYNRAPPDTTLTMTPAQLTNVTTATFVFSSSKEGTFFCTIDGAEEQACMSPINYEELIEGNHLFAVRAKDIWGTYDATSETYAWMIDTTSPETTLIVGPSILTNVSSATFTFTSVDAEATFGYTIDGGEWQGAVSSLILTTLTDGNHTVTIRAIDGAGNVDATPVTTTWTIDTTPPLAPTFTSPTTNTTYATIATAVTIIGTHEEGAAITVNDATDGVTLPTATTWQKDVALSLGINIFTVKATDAAGNTSAPFTLTITRNENQAPSAVSNLSVTTPIITNDRLTLTWTTPSDTDLPSQTLMYSMRYATTAITDEAAWDAATNIIGLPAVGVFGAAETFIVTGLTPATTYYFALRTSDGELLSALSNSAIGITHYGVRITDAHFQGGVSEEYMGITNERADDQPLQEWKLHDPVLISSHIYTFPAFILASGATVRVHRGDGTNTQTDLYWGKASSVWNDDGDEAFLDDSSGAAIDSVSW
ncbi:MAG: lamin tail domain-containing protein [bacterium]|nr:lamin tail domain-containing protein [bacterium]